jgi:hypothetical protein
VDACEARIRRGIELVDAQEKRVVLRKNLGFDTRLAEQLNDCMKRCVTALIQFQRSCRSSRSPRE